MKEAKPKNKIDHFKATYLPTTTYLPPYLWPTNDLPIELIFKKKKGVFLIAMCDHISGLHKWTHVKIRITFYWMAKILLIY
jgi:hypothetical protein